jgi:hypothetical protein
MSPLYDAGHYAGQRDLLNFLVELGVLVKVDDVTGYYSGPTFIPVYPLEAK